MCVVKYLCNVVMCVSCYLHTVPGSQVSVDKLLVSEVFHSPGHVQSHVAKYVEGDPLCCDRVMVNG